MINQIAAGEVIERPASVLKELLENSLDAGSDRVTIHVEKSGLGLIEVIDHGHGIHRDDLVLSITNHSTSKLTGHQVLPEIATLGFRGEALASIAGVSRMTLASRFQSSPDAYQIRAQASQIESVMPASVEQGTVISVRDLFYCTPVRKRFLSSEKTEWQHIEQVFKRLALSRFQCRFILSHNGKTMYTLPHAESALQKQSRLQKLLGTAFVQHALPVQSDSFDMTLSGWIASPSLERRQPDWQYMYVNGRFVRDKYIQHAIKQAFYELTDEGQPSYVLFLELPGDGLDVNVHPAKLEVRFRDARSVHDFLYVNLLKTLQQSPSLDRSHTVAPALDVCDGMIEKPAMSSEVMEASDPAWQLLTRLYDDFALVESQKHIYLMDIKQLWQSQVKQQLLTAWQHQQSISSQPLAIPESIELPEITIDNLLRFQACFQLWGVGLTRLQRDSIILRFAPPSLAWVDWSACFKAWPGALKNHEKHVVSAIDHLIAYLKMNALSEKHLFELLSLWQAQEHQEHGRSHAVQITPAMLSQWLHASKQLS